MPSPNEVKDPALRASLEAAGRLLDDGEYLECVRISVDVYGKLATQRPELIVRPPTPGQPQNASGGTPGRARAWPSLLGVTLSFDGDKPSLSFDKQRFSMSEAATYFEYTVEQVVQAQQT